jgi:DNA-directed RNA polymerase specialized sigma24 family protein
MRLVDDGSTSPTLLSEVADWQDHPAWVSFRGRYDPLLRRWCHGYSLDDDSIDEVCQRIWIELADRMRTFRYDPNRTFRGWLRRVCDSRVIDFLHQRQAVRLDDRDWGSETGTRLVYTRASRFPSRRIWKTTSGTQLIASRFPSSIT